MTNEWHEAAIEGNVEAAERMLAGGQAIDQFDRHGQTSLMLAAKHGQAAIVERLIAGGARLDVSAKYGLSALMLAIVNHHVEIARALLHAGADTTLEGSGAPGFAGKNAGELARELGFHDLADAIALDQIRRSFASREAPTEITDSKQLSDIEYEEVMSFSALSWSEVSFDQIERNADAIFWFSPDAFCYYLPGFLSVGLRDQRTDSNAYDALIGMLDRSPEPEYWDDFFAPRFSQLSRPELRALAAWVDWLESQLPDGFHPGTYERVRVTLLFLEEARAS